MSLSACATSRSSRTPPQGRRPIRTTVSEYDEDVVRRRSRASTSATARASTCTTASRRSTRSRQKLQQLCPTCAFLVAHGQMRERELEEKMHAFLRGDADVLVSTTIIESGIDIPQANTLIVERADTLGLAQLYQIRGRVGRST
jgi:transcription-repair coupling factor (superfamily II helicase)